VNRKIVILCALVFAGCKGQNEDTETSVKGVYVTGYENEYSRGQDTIQIIPLNEDANSFFYVRRVSYRRLSNGVLGPYKFETDSSTCVFNQATAQLSEQSHGRVYSLSKDGNSLISGNSVYKRIQ
jgi:hypothetical protein